MTWNRWCALATGALLVTLSNVAAAQGTDVAAAEALFNEGRELLKKESFAEASDRFARSAKLDPSVGTLLNLGDSYKATNKVASAWLAYTAARDLAHLRKDADREALARTAAADMEPRLPYLTIQVGPEAPSDLVVTRSGVRVEPAALNARVPTDPGRYPIEASAPDSKPWATTVDVVEGKTVTVSVPTLQHGANTQHTVGIGLEIGGGTLLAAGLVFGALTIAKWGSVTDVCPDAKCTRTDISAQNSARDTAQTFATVSTVGVIVGAAVLVGGIVLHLTSKKSEPATARSPLLGLGLTF